MQQNQTQKLDQDIVNLSKAIRQVESGNKPVLPQEGADFGGKSRYQYSNDTWKEVAGKYLGNPNAELSLENENQATYKRIEDWKKQGYNVGQIASMWNAGAGEPDAYLGTFSSGKPSTGVNEYNVQYDVPGHAQKVADAYKQVKGAGSSYSTPPPKQEFKPADTGFMDKLNKMESQAGLTGKEGGFVSDVSTSLRDVGTNLKGSWSEGQNLGSTGIQALGAIGKGIGDVTDDALVNLPGVGKGYEWATEKIGQFLGAGAEATGVTEWFGGLDPSVQRNIEGGLNAASVIPLFKALKFGKKGIRDTITSATQNKVERKAAEEINNALSNVKERRIIGSADKRGLNPVETVVKNPQYLPDMTNENGKWKWDTTKQTELAQQNISAKNDVLQNLLDSTAATQAAGIPLATVRSQVLKDAIGNKRFAGKARWENKINDIFDNIKYGYGADYISLSDLNQIKRQVREEIDFDSPNPFKNPLRELDNEIQSSVMKQVEDYAKKVGLNDVAEMNQGMARDITAKKVLEMLGGKPVKSGPPSLMSSAGNAITLGVAKPLIDYRKSRAKPSSPTNKLKDRRPLRETAQKGLAQLGVGLGLSGQLGREE